MTATVGMQSNFQYPLRKNFPQQHKEPPLNGKHSRLVEMALDDAINTSNIFVDCSTSVNKQYLIYAHGAVPCVTPKHPYYSCSLERYLTGTDLLACQGLWPSCFSEDGYKALMADERFAQDLSGNSFSSTVAQAVLLASFACCEHAWDATEFAPIHPEAQMVPTPPSTMLSCRRIRGKRSAPEFDHALLPAEKRGKKNDKNVGEGIGKEIVREPKNARKRVYKRKDPGCDSRTKSKGKKATATIWQREQVSGPHLC